MVIYCYTSTISPSEHLLRVVVSAQTASVQVNGRYEHQEGLQLKLIPVLLVSNDRPVESARVCVSCGTTSA